jgi:hypothetical protein
MENTTRIKQTTRTKVTSYGGTPAEVWEYLVFTKHTVSTREQADAWAAERLS